MFQPQSPHRRSARASTVESSAASLVGMRGRDRLQARPPPREDGSDPEEGDEGEDEGADPQDPPDPQQEPLDEDVENRARNQAGKDLATSLTLVPLLFNQELKPKDPGNFFRFDKAMQQEQIRLRWPPGVLDIYGPTFTPSTPKERADTNVIYSLLVNKTVGHGTATVVAGVAAGAAQLAYRSIFEFFFRATVDGKKEVKRAYENCTMASSGLSIRDFVQSAKDHRRALLLMCGAGAEEEPMFIGHILNSLLDEFQSEAEYQKKEQRSRRPPSLEKVERDIYEFAAQKGLEDLTKHGPPNRRSSVFNVDNAVCRQWSTDVGCPRGSKCRYSHPAGKGHVKKREADSEANLAAATRSCFLCKSPAHMVDKCPHRADFQKSLPGGGGAAVHVANASGSLPAADFVFPAYVVQEDDDDGRPGLISGSSSEESDDEWAEPIPRARLQLVNNRMVEDQAKPTRTLAALSGAHPVHLRDRLTKPLDPESFLRLRQSTLGPQRHRDRPKYFYPDHDTTSLEAKFFQFNHGPDGFTEFATAYAAADQAARIALWDSATPAMQEALWQAAAKKEAAIIYRLQYGFPPRRLELSHVDTHVDDVAAVGTVDGLTTLKGLLRARQVPAPLEAASASVATVVRREWVSDAQAGRVDVLQILGNAVTIAATGSAQDQGTATKRTSRRRWISAAAATAVASMATTHFSQAKAKIQGLNTNVVIMLLVWVLMASVLITSTNSSPHVTQGLSDQDSGLHWGPSDQSCGQHWWFQGEVLECPVPSFLSEQFVHNCDREDLELPTVKEDSFNAVFIIGVLKNGQGEWCSDSGTNRFVTNDRRDFLPGSEVANTTVVAVGSGKITSNMTGTIRIKSAAGVIVDCKDALYLPECSKKLIPTSPFIKKGCELVFGDLDKVTLRAKDGTIIFQGVEKGGLYYYDCKTVHVGTSSSETPTIPANSNISTTGSSPPDAFFGLPVGSKMSEGTSDFNLRLLEAHQAYGHLNFDKLRVILGLKKAKPGCNPSCVVCTLATSRKHPLAKEKPPHARAARVNMRKHLDLGFTSGCDLVFQVVVDDFTRVSYLDVLDSKADSLQSFSTLQRHHDNLYYPQKLAIVRTDSEPVYKSNAWDEHCKAQGYEREFSSRYRHDQNGVAERAIQTIGNAYRSMMHLGAAPGADSPEALRHANVVRNFSPTKSNGGWTPLEKEAGMKLAVNQRLLKGPIFCLAMAHVYEEERLKDEQRAVPCVYLGYDPGSNAYKVKDWLSGRKYYTADLTFFPNKFPYRANPLRMADWLHGFDEFRPQVVVQLPAPRVRSSSSAQQVATRAPPTFEAPSQPPRRSGRISEYQLSGTVDVRNVPDQDVAPDVAQLLLAFPLDDEERDLFNVDAFFTHNFGSDPTSWDDAMASPYANEWIAARLKEQSAFQAHKVYKLVPRESAKGKKIFHSKPVYKMKIDPPTIETPGGSIEKFRYRMTIAAFTRMLTQGIDYEEKFASTVRWDSVKILLAIACKEDYDIILFDIATFFLYGRLPQGFPVYMEQPEGWEEEGKPKSEFIWEVEGNMYGLPQASHIAQQELKATLTKEGKFKPTMSDDCVYTLDRKTTAEPTNSSSTSKPTLSPSDHCSLCTHVDDIMAAGTTNGLATLEASLQSKFDITKKINPTTITGVQIERVRSQKWLKIHQHDYTVNLLITYDMLDCNGVDTPLDKSSTEKLMALPCGEPDPLVIKKYQQLVGALMWLIKTRPDMAFTVNMLSRFLKSATQAHLDIAMGRPLRFLKKTLDYGLVFITGSDDWQLTGAADSDLGGDKEGSRSLLGYYAKLGEFGSVLTGCSLDKKVCTSSGQAETYAMLNLVKSVVWTRILLAELGYPFSEPIRLLTDNDGVLKQSTKVINHTTAKHYRIAQAYVRQHVLDQIIAVQRIDTKQNTADIFTKPLDPVLFIRHQLSLLGPQQKPAERPAEIL